MLRRIAIAGLMVLGTCLVAQADVARPTLKSTVTVDGDIVHIGDLIAHAGKLGNIAIFRAPDLGCTGSVPTARVLDAVRPYGLKTIDTGHLSAVVVTHASRSITPKAIEHTLRQALSERVNLGDPADLTLQLDRRLHTLQIESDATGDLEVARLSYNPVGHRFDALLYVPDSTLLRRSPLRLTGTVTETARVVVLRRSLQRGEIINTGDVTVERRPRARVGRDRLDRTGLAVGMAVHQALPSGHVLRRSDLIRPQLVHRNEMVTLVYEVPGILLTVRAKALEDGAQGDAVSVLNLQSKRTIAGTVTGPGRVTVEGTLSIRPAQTASLQ